MWVSSGDVTKLTRLLTVMREVSGEDQSAAEFFISDVMWNSVLSVRERSLLGGIDWRLYMYAIPSDLTDESKYSRER